MGCSDKGETPPPLPLKSNTADYGNLLDNQDLTSPSTPPPPPPHQRVGVLIRAESSSLMMHGTCNETSDRYTHLTFGSASSTIPCSCTSCADVREFVHAWFFCLHLGSLWICPSFLECVSQKSVGISQLAARAHTHLSIQCYLYSLPLVLRRD